MRKLSTKGWVTAIWIAGFVIMMFIPPIAALAFGNYEWAEKKFQSVTLADAFIMLVIGIVQYFWKGSNYEQETK